MTENTKNVENTRLEKDSMGELRVPVSALYGAQTQRAVNNFPISGLCMPTEFINAVCLIKEVVAIVNVKLGLLDVDRAEAIKQASLQIQNGTHTDQFPLDIFQTGSGTSTNMNVNEVLARLASKILGSPVSANDDVNMGQSSNDVIPTALHLSAAIAINTKLLPALIDFKKVILRRAEKLANTVKTGRTHLMDAMPITLGQELSGWASQIDLAHKRIASSLPRLQQLAQGGTAVGTGINTPPEFSREFISVLATRTNLQLTSKDSFFEGLASQDTAVEVSGQLKALATAVMKIANDLRWMNSGPIAGLSEIELPALQPGSSIMPGKINPVIPEAAAMVAAQVIGNDATITIAGQSGSFQLNVMLPVIAYNLLQSISIMAAVIPLLGNQVANFKVHTEMLEKPLKLNPILVTSLNPKIGYLKAAQIAKQAYKEGRPIIDVAEENTDIPRSQLEKLLDPLLLTKGGIQ